MSELKTICFDSNCMDIATGEVYSAGTNIDISNNVISLKTSPALSGTPTAPTNGTASTSNTQIATTAFVQNAIKRRIPSSRIEVNRPNLTISNNSYYYTDVLWTAPSNGSIICDYYVNFNTNATGNRLAALYWNNTTQANAIRVPACSGAITQISSCGVHRVTTGATVKIVLWQTSGSNLVASVCNFRGLFYPD